MCLEAIIRLHFSFVLLTFAQTLTQDILYVSLSLTFTNELMTYQMVVDAQKLRVWRGLGRGN